MSKSHPEQWMIREAVERPEKSLVTALAAGHRRRREPARRHRD